MQKDLSKLRPYTHADLEEDAPCCDHQGQAIPSMRIIKALLDSGNDFLLRRMPLAWLEGYPVYGDHWVYRTAIGDCVQTSEMGYPALAISAGNVRWPTLKEVTNAVLSRSFLPEGQLIKARRIYRGYHS